MSIKSFVINIVVNWPIILKNSMLDYQNHSKEEAPLIIMLKYLNVPRSRQAKVIAAAGGIFRILFDMKHHQ